MRLLELIIRWLRRGAPASKDVARERLRLVLVHDRAGVSPNVLESLKEELMEVISRYMEVDTTNLDVRLTQADDSVALMANIPIVRFKVS